jgi:hypothetical protein
MKLPSIETDGWELRSGEASHAKNPSSFWIPCLEDRKSLRHGMAAKLIFDIECVNDSGEVEVNGERMWVIVSEVRHDYFIGILDNKPASFEPDDEEYLVFGAEVPFLLEHIIDIDEPPQEYSDWQLSQKPERLWPR